MPIAIVDYPEPLSRAAARLSADAGVIESDAWRVLTWEMERYCREELAGRSFLISGHRGAGKTTLVSNAYQHVRKRRFRRGELRPLLVQVNGPALFRAEDGAAASASALTGSAAALHEPASSPPAQDDTEPATEWQAALKQIVLALHRAVADEICESHLQRVTESPALAAAQREEMLELSAQLQMEVYEYPMPTRLREFWARPGLLATGVLFQPGAPGARPGQGVRELLALAGVCEAYSRVSGTFVEVQKRNESAARQAEASASGGGSLAVLAPVASLAAGGAVGTAMQLATASPTAALVAGIASAFASAAVFRYSGTRSSARSASRELNFMPDLSVKTLDRFLPILFSRLMDAGLAPVFVIDELDKVRGLPEKMVELLRQLKKVFAESAFFCFVTDRRYFEALRRLTSDGTYPPISTYFSHQIYVAYRHDDLHSYLRTRLQPVETAAR